MLAEIPASLVRLFFLRPILVDGRAQQITSGGRAVMEEYKMIKFILGSAFGFLGFFAVAAYNDNSTDTIACTSVYYGYAAAAVKI
jgi:hypothetical protein